MAEAKRDGNRVTTLLTVSSSDVDTPVNVYCKPTSHALYVADGIAPDSGSTDITPLTVKGGVVRVIDSATGDIVRTTSGWNESEIYGWYSNISAANASSQFDTTTKYNGKKTLLLQATDATGRISAYMDEGSSGNGGLAIANLKKGIVVKPNTVYKFSIFIKGVNEQSNSAGFVIYRYTSAGAYVDATTVTSVPVGNSDFTEYSSQFTTGATVGLLTIRLVGVNVANSTLAKTYFAWDDASLKEVTTITNSSSAPALLYPKVTAVSSNDNIDQSNITAPGAVALGDAANNRKLAQLFTPTKKNLTSVSFRRSTSVGTFTGTVTVSIEGTTSSLPNGTVYSTLTYTNAQWEALSDSAEIVVSIPYTLIPGTVYAITFTPSTSDASNYARIFTNTSGGGAIRNNGSWIAYGTNQFYFKTLYSKNTTNFTVSTDTQTISVTAPTTDGWANGTVIDTANLGVTPLTLAPGVNNVYYSSNGAATADGTVDASLQATVGGKYYSSSTGTSDAIRDANHIPVSMAVSSEDGITPVPLYADSNNKLLIKTT